MAFRTISQFKGQLAGGGVRPNLFEVELNFPNGAGQTLGFMSNEATPAAENATIDNTTSVAEQSSFHGKGSKLTCFKYHSS